MNQIKILISALIIVVLTACGGEEGSSKDTSVIDNDGDTTENSDSEPEEDQNQESEVLSLGETGVMDNTLGEYEITIDSIKKIDSHEEHHPTVDFFLIADITVTNIGDNEIDGNEVSKSDLFNDEEISFQHRTHLDFVNIITEDILPGETVTGQILFDTRQSDWFQLVFGYARSTVSNELTWEFTEDEITEG